MVRWNRVLAAACVWVGLQPGLVMAEAPPRIAVLELRGELSRGQLAVMSDKVRAGVLQALHGKNYVVMSRENMAMLLRDMGLDCETAEGECEVETGRNIGAAYVVSGSVEDVGGGLWLCSVKIHDTETGALKATGDVRGKQVIQLIDQLPSAVAAVMVQAFGGGPKGATYVPMPVVQTGPTQAQFNLDFGSGAGGLGVQAKLKEQQCERDAQQKGTRARAVRMTDAVAMAQSQASRAWAAQKTELEMCTRLEHDQRDSCVSAVEQWLRVARSMTVDLPAGVETVQTDCGSRQPAFSKESRTITGDDVGAAELLLKRLNAYSPGSRGGTNSVGMSFVRISSGSFVMGSSSSEKGRDTDERSHRVVLTRDFMMATTEVTQRQYKDVMGSSPAKTSYKTVSLRGDNYPVQMVSWSDATKFANALSKREGLQPAYRGSGSSIRWDRRANGYRLPTEAEWEYAARAGSHRLYAGADRVENLCRVANVADKRAKGILDRETARCDDGYGGTSPVGTYTPNDWNLYDMTGNVAEWAWDWYGAYASSATDPAGPGSGTYRCYRGGSWVNTPRATRIAYRNRNKVDSKFDGLGFRLARNAD